MRKLYQKILSWTLLTAAFFLLYFGARTISDVRTAAKLQEQPITVVIDPGHGGEDGGTSSADGVMEAPLNLRFSQTMRDILTFSGIPTRMVRDADVAVYTGDCRTISQKKVSDLKNRVKLVNETPNAVLLSVHQNFFEQSKYHGAQVFFAKTPDSQALAEAIQAAIRAGVDPENHRQCKPSQSVYLMEHIQCPGVLVECGFLSNPREAGLLQDETYQRKLSAAVCAALISYINEEQNNEV